MGTFRYDPQNDRYDWDPSAVGLLAGTVGPHSTYQDILSRIPRRARKAYDEWRMQALTARRPGAARIPYRLPDREIVLQVHFHQVDGAVEGVIIDVTRDEAAQEAVRTQQLVANFAERLLHFGTWAYDIEQDAFTASPGAADLMLPGESPADFTFEKALALVRSNDRAKVRRAYERALASGQPQQVEFRLADGGGWRMLQFMRVLDGEGEPAFTCGLVHDTTSARAHAYTRLEVERLRHVEDLRSRLVHVAAHELSQPLTPMRLELSMLADSMPDNEQAAQAFTNVQRNVDRLESMVNDLIDAARSQAGRLSVTLEPVLPNEHIEHTVATMRPLARERDVEIAWTPSDLPAITGDPLRLQQCLSNLIHNAIKFTASGSRIEVGAAVDRMHLCIAVRDQGPGLSRKQQKLLFTPFQQIHPSPRGFVSTGLGLYITNALMEAMHGDVGVDTAVGKGSTFSLRFPLAKKGTGAAAARADGGRRPDTAAMPTGSGA